MLRLMFLGIRENEGLSNCGTWLGYVTVTPSTVSTRKSKTETANCKAENKRFLEHVPSKPLHSTGSEEGGGSGNGHQGPEQCARSHSSEDRTEPQDLGTPGVQPAVCGVRHTASRSGVRELGCSRAQMLR